MRSASAIGLVVLALAVGCAPTGTGGSCEIYCVSDEPGLPPNRVECLDDDGLVCAPILGCRDSTPVTTLICTGDGPRCRDGSEPLCTPTE